MRNIHGVLEYGAIVASHEEFDVLITWNGSATFNWWNRLPATLDEWTNVDVMTTYGDHDLDTAIKIAEEWIEEALTEEVED